MELSTCINFYALKKMGILPSLSVIFSLGNNCDTFLLTIDNKAYSVWDLHVFLKERTCYYDNNSFMRSSPSDGGKLKMAELLPLKAYPSLASLKLNKFTYLWSESCNMNLFAL